MVREKDRKERDVKDYEEKVLYINRCAKVVKGGRKFSFSALILIGDQNGTIGYGFAKANEVSDAIRKGSEAARKNVLTINLVDGTIPHAVLVNWDGAELMMKPAPDGTGIIAGGKVRAVLEMVGIKNVVAKSRGSNNAINQVRAAFKALTSLKTKETILQERGIGQ